MDVTVIAESTPGPVAINCATFVGFRQAGLLGALVATTGVILPSFAVIYIIALCLDDFMKFKIVAHAFKGITVAVGITILDAAISMIKDMKKTGKSIGIMFIAFVLMLLADIFAWNISSVTLLFAAALFGGLSFQIQKIQAKTGGTK